MARVALATAAVLLLGAAPVARAAYMAPGQPIRPKDFTLVKKDGYYHLFFIVNSTANLPDKNEAEFGHAISPDLYHWIQLPHVMHVDSLGWDNSHVWAPNIVQRDSLYYMFYSGVTSDATHNHTQRIGLAVSSDLMTWTRVGNGPILSADQVPWAWGDSTSGAPAFRDPYVMPDPQNPGSWLMYYVASYRPDSVATVVGVARSSGDLTQWTDVGPLLITWRNWTFNSLTESPHMFQHDGLWYLFVTTESGQPLSFYTSPNPVGALGEWTYRGRLRTMLGFDTATWFASECVRDGTHDLFAFVAGDRIEIRDILWSGSWTFALLQPPFFHVVTMNWQEPQVAEGDTAHLLLRSANYYAGPPALRTFVVDSLGGETEVPADSLGFDPAPVLPSDSTVIAWPARRWPRVPDTDSTTVTRVRLRTPDSTAVSNVVTVGHRRYQVRVTGLTWGEAEVRAGAPAHLGVRASDWFAGPPALGTFVVDALGGETAVAPESLGFDAHPALTSDSTALAWVARRWPTVPDTDTVTVTRVRVRAAGDTTSSGVLTVRAPVPPPLTVGRLGWLEPHRLSGELAHLAINSTHGRNGVVALETFEVDAQGVETAVPPESLGFDPHPPLAADSTVVGWLARRWPAVPDTDTVTVTRVRVRVAGGGAASGILTVHAPLQTLHVLGLAWSQPAVPARLPVSVVITTRNFFAGPPHLLVFVVDGVGAETAVAPESLEFAAAPWLFSDRTLVSWPARRWPRVPDTDTVTVTRYRLRTLDGAASGLLTVTAPAGPEPPAPPDTGDVQPSPDRRRISIRPLPGGPGDLPLLGVHLAARGVARVDVFDVMGRHVRNLVASELPEGDSVLRWDGRDQGGARLRRGVYFARLTSGGHATTARIVLLDP